MPLIKCLGEIAELNPSMRDKILSYRDKYLKKGLTERQAELKAVEEYGRNLHGQLNGIKEKVGAKKDTYIPYNPKPKIEEIERRYAEESSKNTNEEVGSAASNVKDEVEGFTEGSDLNRMLANLKSKYGDKKGSALYEAANRLVNPNKNTIIEIRGNGVVVKEGGKYILKPFGNTDASSKKWTLYKGLDITDQFTTQEAKQKTKEIERATTEESTGTIPSNEQKSEGQKTESGVQESTIGTGQTEPARTPPVPPVEGKAEGAEMPKNDKGILNRLYESKNLSAEAKAKLEAEGLKYKTSSQEEARAVAKGVVKEFGLDEAVLLAEAGKFEGDVNSMIFAEAIDQVARLEEAAKTPEEKLKYAAQWAEYATRYDEAARSKGRFISAIQDFYKKSPLGIVMMENAKRKDDFNDWAKPKEQSWKDFFKDFKETAEFKEAVDEKVKEQLKEERIKSRANRIAKVRSVFAKAKAQFSKGATYSTFIPPHIIETALETMELAYEAGEAVVKIVGDAVDYISQKMGNATWDKDKFRKEWEEKLGKDEPKSKKTVQELSEEKKQKLLDKFRDKLKGLSEKEKDEVIRKSFKKLVESGALEYQDFKDIIAETLGLGKLTDKETARLIELVKEINSVEELGEKARESDRSEAALNTYRKAKINAEKAATELGNIVYNKPDITNRLLSIMQLNTLGIPSLVNNPLFNVFNQATVRFPRSVIMTALDYGISGVGKMMGKDIKVENDVVRGQAEFWRKLWEGSRQSAHQLLTGLTNKDYFQKEVKTSQIHPATSWMDLWDFAKGEKKLSKSQVADKVIQGTVGVPAEIIARALNIGDKPQRYASEGSQAATFAKNLGLKDIDYKLFMEFPKEEAYRQFKKQGLSDEVAAKKAQEIQDRIIKEGEESTFQQDNLLNDAITAAFKPFGKPGEVVKKLNMPFIKIPLNAFWSVYNLVNPQVALLQSMVYAGKAFKTKSPLDVQQSKKWFAHAVTGMGLMYATGLLVNSGIVSASNDDNTSKKEREGETNYKQQNSINMGKLQALLEGKNPDDVKDGLIVDLKWWGNVGQIMGYQAKKIENMTPEQKKNGMDFTEDMLANMQLSALDFMDKGVFSNSSAMLTAINRGGSFMDNYLINLINMGSNIIHPAAAAQISRAQLPYYSKAKGDTFFEKVKNNMLTRSSALRSITGNNPPSKVGLWGDRLDKKDNVPLRLFGMSRDNKDNFAQPIYEDYEKTKNTAFFPSAIKPEITVNGTRHKLNTKEAEDLEILVGQNRKNLVAPYVNNMARFEGSKQFYKDIQNPDDKVKKLSILYEVGYEKGVQEFLKKYPKYNTGLSTKEQKDKKVNSKQNELLRKAAQSKK